MQIGKAVEAVQESEQAALKMAAEEVHPPILCPIAVSIHLSLRCAEACDRGEREANLPMLTLQLSKRRSLHNELVELRGAIRCVARVRPLDADEDVEGRGAAVRQVQGPGGKLSLPRLRCFYGHEKTFEMDHILGHEVGSPS